MRKLNLAIIACLLLIVSCFGVYAQEIIYVSPREVAVSASDVLQLSTAPQNVIKGDRNSRWTSSDIDNPQWIELSFPHKIDFPGIVINWFSKNTRAKSVQLYLSMDGETWTEVDFTKETLSSGYIDQFTFPNQTAQHLRIVMADPAGLAYSISSVEIPGIVFDFPFYLQAGYGSGQGEAYLESEGERLGLDVLHIWYSHTFTRRWDIKQEYYLAKGMVNYRDWVEQVIGHNMDQTYHLLVSDELLKRSEISEREPNSFWLAPGDAWQNLRKFNISPSDYDLVWSVWAWENRADAQQMYGGAALTGPNTTPFQSYSVEPFTEPADGIFHLHAHESQHTYESLFNESGIPVVTDPPEDGIIVGIIHADRQSALYSTVLDSEPDLYMPEVTYEEARTAQLLGRVLDAWALRYQPRENYLKIAQRFGRLVPPREDLIIEPLFASVTIITDTEQRDVYLALRARNRGMFVDDLNVTARIGDRVFEFTEDSYQRTGDARMPRQVRWSIGWDGHSFYGGWVSVNKGDTQIELTVTGDGIEEVFTIPITFIVFAEEEIVIQDGVESDYVYDQVNVIHEDGMTKFGDGSSLEYEIPLSIFTSDDLAGYSIEITGNGYIGLKINLHGVFSSSVWSGELRNETAAISIPKGTLKMFEGEENLYLELEMPRFRPSEFKNDPWFNLERFAITRKNHY
ncbi:MAG: discoidin domain-containing protein [Firmicutes bacterium]|nr:discoidin domain-containing protein [Bacillota bacterium]NLL89302.1 discoidin domain-containing protein [Bacillota bacterium]HKM17284.1 discoidin domain-containing protein [Limnochordia bacterium]